MPNGVPFCTGFIDNVRPLCEQLTLSSPIQNVSGGTDWFEDTVSIFSSSNFSAAIKADGTLWLWGSGGCGRLGTNSTSARSSPVQTVSTGTNWKQAGLGFLHSAAIKTDGTLWIWGYGANGRLGNNLTINQSSPVQTVSNVSTWKQVSAGRHTSAVKTDGTLWLWGCNNYGQLGNNSTIDRSSPIQTTGANATIWKQVSAGQEHSAAIKTDGTLWLWGEGGSGQLGANVGTDRSSPVQTVSATTTWTEECAWCSFSAGFRHSSAIKTDGTLWLWGRNVCGQLGNNSKIDQSSPVQTVSTGTNWKQVSTGSLDTTVTAAIKTDGTLWLWGEGGSGRLGNNSTIDQSSPVQTVSTGTNWKQVSLGNAHSAAIKTDGTLWLWGGGGQGRLGNNATLARSSPVQTVSTGTNWSQVALGGQTSAALKTDGTLWLWGSNCCGMIGNNSTIDQSSPVQTVTTGTNWKLTSLGRYHSAAVKTDGTLWTWGLGFFGQLGHDSNTNHSSPVQTVSTGTNWKQVALGMCHSAAVKTDGTLWLWGCGACGRLGNNSTLDRSSPVQTVSTGTNWKQVTGGGYHSLALSENNELYGFGDNSFGQLGCNFIADNTVPFYTDLGKILVEKCYLIDVYPNIVPWIKAPALWTWGCNNNGQLGNNSTLNQSSPVQTVSNGSNWSSISDGYCNKAAIKTDGTLWLWGCGALGRLGNNSTIDRSSPVQTVTQGTNWKQVSTQRPVSSSVKTDGTLWLWGRGVGGVLGNNSTTDRSSPVQTVSNVTTWKKVTAAYNEVMAIKTDGTLWVWGFNSVGSLGDNSTTAKCSPVQTASNVNTWKDISKTAVTHMAAIKTDGTLWLWGCGVCGTIGNNSTANQSSPVQTVTTGTNWKQVSLGAQHSAAIKTDGTLWLWGRGNSGQLGTNSTTDRSSPVQTVSTGNNWKLISTNIAHSSAIKTDGTLWLWGGGTGGNLGNNSTLNQSSPVQTIMGGQSWKDVSGFTAINEVYDW